MDGPFHCPACQGDTEIIATSNRWRYYCRSCDRRFNEEGEFMEDNPTRITPENHQSEDLSADERIRRAVDAGERERQAAELAEQQRKQIEELEAKRRETLPRCPYCECGSDGKPGPVIFATVPISLPPGLVALCIYCANPACRKAFNVIPMPRPSNAKPVDQQPGPGRQRAQEETQPAQNPGRIVPVAAMPDEVLRKK